jgi:hypothetical protein
LRSIVDCFLISQKQKTLTAMNPKDIVRAGWLQSGGYFLATVGTDAWTGTEADWLDIAGGLMYWSHADIATYQRWYEDQGFRICWTRFIPEGNSGHTLLMAQKPAP